VRVHPLVTSCWAQAQPSTPQPFYEASFPKHELRLEGSEAWQTHCVKEMCQLTGVLACGARRRWLACGGGER